MKAYIPLIAGVILIITPQIIVGVVAANTAWVEGSYLHAVGQIESNGHVPSQMLGFDPLPAMPFWMMLTSTALGVMLCVIAIVWGVRGGESRSIQSQ